jgi:hypothetical protein
MTAEHPVADVFACVGLCGIAGWWTAHAEQINTDVQIIAGILTALAAVISICVRFQLRRKR